MGGLRGLGRQNRPWHVCVSVTAVAPFSLLGATDRRLAMRNIALCAGAG